MAIKNMPNFDDIEDANDSKEKNNMSGLSMDQDALNQLSDMIGDMSDEEIASELFSAISGGLTGLGDDLKSLLNKLPHAIDEVEDGVDDYINYRSPMLDRLYEKYMSGKITEDVLRDLIESEYISAFTEDESEDTSVWKEVADKAIDSLKQNPANSVEEFYTIIEQAITDTFEVEDQLDDELDSKLDSNGQPTAQATATIKVHPDETTDIFLNRKDKMYNFEYIPFNPDDLKDAFGFTDDEFEKMEFDTAKLGDFLPSQWAVSNPKFTMATQFFDGDNTKFILCTLLPNFNSSDVKMTASFVLFKDKFRVWNRYIIKRKNLVKDDCSLMSLIGDVYTKEYVDTVSKNNTQQQYSNLFNANTVPQTDTDLIRKLYVSCINEIQFNEETLYGYCNSLFINTVDHPTTSISMIGELTPSAVTKQETGGYVYIGDITLNDSDECKWFISDYNIKCNKTLEFYIKCADDELDANTLVKMKDTLNEVFDNFTNHYLLKNVELEANNKFAYIDVKKL